MFVAPGQGVRQAVDVHAGGLPLLRGPAPERGQGAVRTWACRRCCSSGCPQKKDETGSEAASPKGAVQQAVRRLKKELPELLVITDVCLCGYTSHGHCGLIHQGEVDNDASLEALAQVAVSHAEAGADMVAPSDMMDGRVGRHPGGPGRTGLRDGAHHELRGEVRLQLLRALPGSGGVAPRPSATAAPTRWTRPTPGRPCGRRPWTWRRGPTSSWSSRPCLTWTSSPSWPAEFDLPLAAYQVSGEYSMIKAAAPMGWLDETAVMLESLTAIKRAGADLILTYFAKQAAALLK